VPFPSKLRKDSNNINSRREASPSVLWRQLCTVPRQHPGRNSLYTLMKWYSELGWKFKAFSCSSVSMWLLMIILPYNIFHVIFLFLVLICNDSELKAILLRLHLLYHYPASSTSNTTSTNSTTTYSLNPNHVSINKSRTQRTHTPSAVPPIRAALL
jgi:hypothetical protein